MPLYDYKCADCGKTTEVLASGSDAPPVCGACGGSRMERLLSAPSSLTGSARKNSPGPGDHTCCGSEPGHGSCAGPGSCCGKI